MKLQFRILKIQFRIIFLPIMDSENLKNDSEENTISEISEVNSELVDDLLLEIMQPLANEEDENSNANAITSVRTSRRLNEYIKIDNGTHIELLMHIKMVKVKKQYVTMKTCQKPLLIQ
jgi:myo-inositol catabolism protein IolC